MAEYVKKVKIEHGIDGDTQESSFANATLQSCMTSAGYVDVSIAIHIDPPAMLNEWALSEWIDAGLCVLPEGFRAEVQISNPEEV